MTREKSKNQGLPLGGTKRAYPASLGLFRGVLILLVGDGGGQLAGRHARARSGMTVPRLRHVESGVHQRFFSVTLIPPPSV
jgi:hypothetical protein